MDELLDIEEIEEIEDEDIEVEIEEPDIIEEVEDTENENDENNYDDEITDEINDEIEEPDKLFEVIEEKQTKPRRRKPSINVYMNFETFQELMSGMTGYLKVHHIGKTGRSGKYIGEIRTPSSKNDISNLLYQRGFTEVMGCWLILCSKTNKKIAETQVNIIPFEIIKQENMNLGNVNMPAQSFNPNNNAIQDLETILSIYKKGQADQIDAFDKATKVNQQAQKLLIDVLKQQAEESKSEMTELKESMKENNNSLGGSSGLLKAMGEFVGGAIQGYMSKKPVNNNLNGSTKSQTKELNLDNEFHVDREEL